MATYPVGYRIAQTIGLSGAAWLSGKSPNDLSREMEFLT